MTGNRIVGPDARKKIQSEFVFDQTRIVRYPFKPFDIRWCYVENLRPLFSEPSPQLLSQRFEGNSFFITRDTADKETEGPPFYFSKLVCDYDSISGHARHFPILLQPSLLKKSKASETQEDLFGLGTPEINANLSIPARAYLASLGLTDLDSDTETAALVWRHALAIGYSPIYLTENADGIRQDWPRIPLPATKDLLLASAELGRKVAALLDTETAVAGVTSGSIRAELKVIGVAATADGKPLNREAGDFDVAAGWGHGGQRGITMPGKGKMIPRDYTAAERAAIEQGASELGLTPELAFAHLGEQTCDVYLNGNAYWRNVPLKVWEYTIGGYQVMKKWLSYRERELLGRALTLDEVREVTNMARRIAAIRLLEPALDENYRAVKENCYDWQARG